MDNIVENKRFYWLDMLRFLAAFLVLAGHFRGAFFVDYMSLSPEQQNASVFCFFSVTRVGHEAVLVFFVLSGFLVGGKAIERVQNGTFRVSGFAVDRSVRIMLPLISCLLLFIPTAMICGIPIVWADWFGCLFSLQWIYTGVVVEPLWSLNYEVWFYVLTGAITVVFTKKQVRRFAGGVVIFIVFLVFTSLSLHCLIIWFMGAIAYKCMPTRRNRGLLLISVILIIMILIALQSVSGSHLDTGLAKYLPTTNKRAIEIWFAFAVCLLIQQLVLSKPRFKISCFIERSGTKLAAFSYTLYLTHVLVLRLLEHFGAPKSTEVNVQSVMLYVAWLCVAMLFAYIVYFFFEKRTSFCKRYIKRKLKVG